METLDFAPIVHGASSVVVFWDAHGFGPASGILGGLMPLIANKPHLVICHDMVDSRLGERGEPREYGGRQIWRGMDQWYAARGAQARVFLGWTRTVVDQIIPILDFCWRNQIEFCSVDYDIHLSDRANLKAKVAQKLGYPVEEELGMGYFTLESSPSRTFPARS